MEKTLDTDARDDVTPAKPHPLDNLVPPSDDELGLSKEEQVVIALYSRPRKTLSETERAEMTQELELLRKQQRTIQREHLEYQKIVCKSVGCV